MVTLRRKLASVIFGEATVPVASPGTVRVKVKPKTAHAVQDAYVPASDENKAPFLRFFHEAEAEKARLALEERQGAHEDSQADLKRSGNH